MLTAAVMAQRSNIPQLPQELVTRVLRYVDLQQRLGSCSLVCIAWRAAAGAATSTGSKTWLPQGQRTGQQLAAVVECTRSRSDTTQD